jgi:photosystem II stability/assembly factor-like uncharacterized protein
MRKLSLIIVCLSALLALSCSSGKVPGTWNQLDTTTGDAFYSVNFVSDKIGWLNGQTDRTFESPDENANANANSNRSTKPTSSSNKAANKNAQKEDPLKANQGFEVLHTTDGGNTWAEIPDMFKNKIRSVWFVDPSSGWALTIDRDILHTTDGGASWSLQRKAGTVKLKLIGNRREPEMDQPEQIDRIHFLDANHGWAWGGGRKDEYSEQPGILLATVNGGTNWNQVPYPFQQSVSTIFFRNAQKAWASTMDGGFYKTVDGALNWTRIQSKLPELVFNSIYFLDDDNGWVVGRSGRMAKTADGGRTWRKMVEIKDQFVMRSITFSDKNRGWAVGDNGAILYTPDAGDTWLSLDSPVTSKLTDIIFINDHMGWAAGLAGVVLEYRPSAAK